jgi:phosphatidylglycerophosphate synthase
MRKIPRNCENPIDNINIDFAEKLCPLFKTLHFTPNGITTLSLFFGLISIYSLYKGNLIAFGVIYYISYFFDVMDGHYARKYKQTSDFGDYYDHIKDFIVVTGVIAVLVYRLVYVHKRCNVGVTLTCVAICAIMFILMTMHLGCQEQIYDKLKNKDSESASLNFTRQMCGNPKYIRWLRYFGCASAIIIFILVVVIIDLSSKHC